MVDGCCSGCRLLQRGSMFVFSHSQFHRLLGISADWTADTLLDLGNVMATDTRQAKDIIHMRQHLIYHT